MSRRSPIGAALRPLAWGYGALVRFDRWRRTKLVTPHRAPVTVVSVGNVTAGGTGKGPFVRWIVEALRAEGRAPAIALRGYRASAAGSDEAREHAALLPGTPVLVGADRWRSITGALARGAVFDTVVLDDGFQHWRLARDLDLVLVDALRPGFDEAMLPAGALREPWSSLRRADAVVVTRAGAIDSALAARIESWHGRAPIAWCRHAWSRIDRHAFDEQGRLETRREGAAWIDGLRVGVVAGLGHPEAFFEQVRAAARDAQWLLRARDHASYDAPALERVVRAATAQRLDAVVTTMKDWVKLEPLLRARRGRATDPSTRSGAGDASGAPIGVPVAVPIAHLEFIAGEEALRTLLRATRHGARDGAA